MKLYVFAVANYLTKRFGQEYRGRGFKFSALAITTKGQLMKTIAYIFRNPLAAGFDRMPSEYRGPTHRIVLQEVAQFQVGI